MDLVSQAKKHDTVTGLMPSTLGVPIEIVI